jgi:hypothetical protein
MSQKLDILGITQGLSDPLAIRALDQSFKYQYTLWLAAPSEPTSTDTCLKCVNVAPSFAFRSKMYSRNGGTARRLSNS